MFYWQTVGGQRRLPAINFYGLCMVVMACQTAQVCSGLKSEKQFEILCGGDRVDYEHQNKI